MEHLQTEHGIFTNNEETGQTAQEVYDEWLVNRDKPPEPTEVEKLRLEQAQANSEIIDLILALTGGMA